MKRVLVYAKALVTALEKGDVGAGEIIAQQISGHLAMERMRKAACFDLTDAEEGEIAGLRSNDPASFYELAMKHAAAIRDRGGWIRGE
jgi:hypothetical protein